MTALRDRLPVVPRAQYEAALRERDGWEQRANDATQRATDARRAILPPAARRSLLAVAIAAMWLVIVGIFLGGAAIPHHDDRPVLTSSTDESESSPRALTSVLAACTDSAETARARTSGAAATACPTARATSGGSRTQPPRRPQPD